MSRVILALMVVTLAVSACGIKRPLMRPSEIPAYEKKRADKMKKFSPKEAPAGTQQPDAKRLDLRGPVPVPVVPE